MLGDMDAFQWVFYYGDRPAMETVGAAILQGWFARFPKMQLLLSEQGTVWVPYMVRKLDHAFLMGRRATWGKLDERPSEYFKEHCFVAPFPEENVDRVVEVVGIEADRVRLRLPPRRGAARAPAVPRAAEEPVRRRRPSS